MELNGKVILITGASGGIGAATARRLAKKGIALALAGRNVKKLEAVAQECKKLGGRPNHAPLVIAEQFGTLETLYPGRIDLGLGRASGTDGATAQALMFQSGY